MKKAQFIYIIGIIIVTSVVFAGCNSVTNARKKDSQTECKEGDVVYWEWTETNEKEYFCVPDPNNCSVINNLCSRTDFSCYEDNCQSNNQCEILYGSSCFFCDDIFIKGCYPKETKNLLENEI